MYLETKSLPRVLLNALTVIGYKKRDVRIEFKDSATLSDCGSDGRRAGVTLVRLDTGETKTFRGSWGGSNLFNAGNPVDNDHSSQAIPENGAVILWSEGYKGTFATVILHPINAPKFLPTGETVSEIEGKILGIYRSIKGGYRAGELARIASTSETGPIVDSLIARGYLKRSSNGATQITTKGKNVASNRF